MTENVNLKNQRLVESQVVDKIRKGCVWCCAIFLLRVQTKDRLHAEVLVEEAWLRFVSHVCVCSWMRLSGCGWTEREREREREWSKVVFAVAWQVAVQCGFVLVKTSRTIARLQFNEEENFKLTGRVAASVVTAISFATIAARKIVVVLFIVQILADLVCLAIGVTQTAFHVEHRLWDERRWRGQGRGGRRWWRSGRQWGSGQWINGIRVCWQMWLFLRRFRMGRWCDAVGQRGAHFGYTCDESWTDVSTRICSVDPIAVIQITPLTGVIQVIVIIPTGRSVDAFRIDRTG